MWAWCHYISKLCINKELNVWYCLAKTPFSSESELLSIYFILIWSIWPEELSVLARKLSVSKHLAVASSGAETDQSWAFQTVLSNPSYSSSMCQTFTLTVSILLQSEVLPTFPSFTTIYARGIKTEASILQSECLLCISYAGNTTWVAPKHYFRGTYLSCRWNYETVFVWEFLLFCLSN